MKLLSQAIVWDVLPAIRAAIAEEPINCGVIRQEAATLPDTTPSAISQYLSGKRGYRIIFEGGIRSLIPGLAGDIIFLSRYSLYHTSGSFDCLFTLITEHHQFPLLSF